METEHRPPMMESTVEIEGYTTATVHVIAMKTIVTIKFLQTYTRLDEHIFQSNSHIYPISTYNFCE